MNIRTIQITEQKSELAVAIKTRASIENCINVCKESVDIIAAHMAKHGKQPSGEPYSVSSYSTETEDFEIEIGVPVDEEIPVCSELFMSTSYGGKIITATSRGTFADAGKLWMEMIEHAKKHTFEPVGIHYDYYLNKPFADAREDDLIIRLVDPIK